MRSTPSTEAAGRLMTICNACRYCEGHCAVFQAMEFRLDFNADTVDYLANLCHNCGACYHNCQYAPPHVFNVNVPAVMAEVRQENYGVYAWPGFMGRLFANNGLFVSLLSVMVITAFIALTAILTGRDFFAVHDNAFYGVISHATLVGIFGMVCVFVGVAFSVSIVKFWRTMQLPSPLRLQWRNVLQGVKDALSLKNLDGGNGQGCSYPNEKPSMARRWFHQCTFWGFMLCVLATSTGTILHYGFNMPAPYGYVSLPKLFGILGGIGLIIGPVGLLILKHKADKAVIGTANKGMDVAFLVILLLSSISGLSLMLVKHTPLVGIALSFHLGVVMTAFLSAPYGKFVHGFYRLIALIVFAIEKNTNQALVGTDTKPTTPCSVKKTG